MFVCFAESSKTMNAEKGLPTSRPQEEEGFAPEQQPPTSGCLPRKTTSQWFFVASQVFFTAFMVSIGSVHWNDCEFIRSLPAWAISFGVVIFILNVVFPVFLWRCSIFQRNSKTLYGFIGYTCSVLSGYGAGLTFPNLSDMSDDKCDETLFYVSVYAVICSIVWAVVMFLTPKSCNRISRTACPPCELSP